MYKLAFLGKNNANGIIPKTIIKEVKDVAAAVLPDAKAFEEKYGPGKPAFGLGAAAVAPEKMKKGEREKLLRSLEKEMREAARKLEFEEAAQLRDVIMEIRAAARKQ